MLWVFIGLVLFLIVSYIVTVKREEKEVSLKDVDAFIVTAILSTLAAHGVISLLDAKKLEGENLISLKENLLKYNGIDELKWNELVNDHIDSTSPFLEGKDLDLG
ncbi:hypothetical protein AAEO50_08435 [Rossellomorea oryzaecorticis]|uniref:Uncharacterized protein n=1 Tax=Rossellomorea oryzaecorticis TaxID=1396505 RepID=A0ABU9K8G1_9BACI